MTLDKRKHKHGHGYIRRPHKHGGKEVHTHHYLSHGRGIVFLNNRLDPIEASYVEAYQKAKEASDQDVLDAFAAMHEDGLLLTDLDEFREAAFYDTGGLPERAIHLKKGEKQFRALLGEDEEDVKKL